MLNDGCTQRWIRKAGAATFDTVFTAVTTGFGALSTAKGAPGALAAARQRVTTGLGEIRNNARVRFSTRFWEELADAPLLSEREYRHPTPGDPIILSPYFGGRIHWGLDAPYPNISGQVWKMMMADTARELGARSLGTPNLVVKKASIEHYKETGDMSRIMADEMPYIEQASHIYFFYTWDMHKRPITLREFQTIMDAPELRSKMTLMQRD